jgi:hypothetical protein
MHCGRCGCQMHKGECPRHTGADPRRGGCPEGIPTEVFMCVLIADTNELLRKQNTMLDFICKVIQSGADQARAAAAAHDIQKRAGGAGIVQARR